MKHFLFIVVFAIINIRFNVAQTLSGGCGNPITQMQPIGVPVYGTSSVGQYPAPATVFGTAPMNATFYGEWCSSSMTVNRVSPAQYLRSWTCSTRMNDAGVITDTNLCGNNYISTKNYDLTGNTAALPVFLAYNLCPAYNISGSPPNLYGGTVIFMVDNADSSTTIGFFRAHPGDPSVILASTTTTPGFPTPATTPFSYCEPFRDVPGDPLSSGYFYQSATGLTFGVYSFTNAFTGLRGFLVNRYILTLTPNTDTVNNNGRVFLYNANDGLIYIAAYVQSGGSGSFTLFDSIPSVGCPPTGGNAGFLVINSTVGYLYTTCYAGDSANPALVSAIYQVGNGVFPYQGQALKGFVRSKTALYQWNYRVVFAGLDNQIMIAHGTSSYQQPRMYCIKDPWNPVFLSNMQMSSSVTGSSLSSEYRISSCYGRSTSCLRTTYFGMSQQGTSAFPVYTEYCGSGVFNNATFCNTDSATCCPNVNCTAPAVEPVCVPATSCTFGVVCQLGQCVNLGNKPDGTVCSTPANPCVKPFKCASGVCTAQGNQPNGFACGANATSCKAASQCVSGTCQPGANKPTGTVCGRNATSCSSADTCSGGVCINGTNFANGTNCGANATNCTTGAICINGSCRNSTNVPDGTSCGASNGTCFTNQSCVSGTCQPSGFAPNTTVCGTTPVISCNFTQICNLGFCVNTSQVPNGTTCGPIVNFCQIQPVCINFACQPIVNKPNTTVCGRAATECYTGDYCFNGTCVNGTNVPDNTTCGAAQSECNTGSKCLSGVCVVGPISANGTICGPNCTVNGTCINGTCVGATTSPDGTVCGVNATSCMTAAVCVSGNCTNPTQLANGTSCGSHPTDVCQTGDICINGACQNNTIFPDGTTCTGGTPPTSCTTGNVCIYNNNTCSQNANLPDGTQCGNVSATNCTSGTVCLFGTCNPDSPLPDGTPCGPINASLCESGNVCLSAICQNNTIIPDGTPCGPVGDCQNQAFCNNGTCPLNPIAPNGTACNVTSVPNLCLNDGYCNGVNLTCISNGTKPPGTICFIELPNSTFIVGVCDVLGDCVINATDGNFTQNLTNIRFPVSDKFPTLLGLILAITLGIGLALFLFCFCFIIGFIGKRNREKVEEEVNKQ